MSRTTEWGGCANLDPPPVPSWDWQLTIHSTKKGFSFVQTDCHGVEVHRGDVSLTTMERLLPILIAYKVLL